MGETQSDGVVDLVSDLVRRAIDARASDVHFEPGDDGLRVRFRVDALLHEVEKLPAAIAPNVIARLKVLSGLLTYRTDLPQEGGMDSEKSGFACDIRVATFPTIRGERAVLRLLTNVHDLMTLEQLGHDPRLIDRITPQLMSPQGLLIVCGPAGSGKTTTLYAMLNYILEHRPGESVFAVEDPVEIRLDGITQVQVQPARGLTYPIALRSLLRQDPQVLMIGEIRDADTADIVIEAALTGHLLLTTLHSGSGAEAIVRLREMGVPAYQLTSTLNGVLAQRLLRTVCGDCETDQPRKDCPTCGGTGFAGRTAIGQFLAASPALRQAILNGADVAELSDEKLSPGSLRQDAQRLLKTGRSTEQEVCRVLGGGS